MPPPIGFITTAATRSLDTAASGSMPKPITRIGVIERAAAHAGEADDEPDDESRERDAEVDVHARGLPIKPTELVDIVGFGATDRQAAGRRG